MELSTEQLVILGFVAMVIVQVYKLLVAKFVNLKINSKTLEIITAVVSCGLAVAFVIKDIQVIDFSDPMEFMGTVLTQVGFVFAAATVIYKYLLKKIFDDLGWNEEKLLKP